MAAFLLTSKQQTATAKMVGKRLEALDMNNFRLFAVCCLPFATQDEL
jgi:hypothetical protein